MIPWDVENVGKREIEREEKGMESQKMGRCDGKIKRGIKKGKRV